MKNKYIVVILLSGAILTIFGAFLKIMHFEFGFVTGNLMLTCGLFLEASAIFIFLIKVIANKQDDFLNR